MSHQTVPLFERLWREFKATESLSQPAKDLLSSLDNVIQQMAADLTKDAAVLQGLEESVHARRHQLAELKRIRQTLVHGPASTQQEKQHDEG